jgi:two-component system phosphate regulon response regulator PhoB
VVKKTLLLVEDNEDLLEVLRITFEAEGFRCLTAVDGEGALKLCKRHGPDLLVLDLMLPGMDGLEVCTEIKRDRALSHIPILMLTAKAEESDVVLGLSLGADDYVPKPARPRELVARVRNLLRRSNSSDPTVAEQLISVAGMVIDPVRFEVRAGDHVFQLTPTEFKLLQILARSPGRVFRRGQLLDSVMGPTAIVTERNVDTHVKSLRKKLEEFGALIETVRGVGYRFSDNTEV